jgi:hypothetical protein
MHLESVADGGDNLEVPPKPGFQNFFVTVKINIRG